MTDRVVYSKNSNHLKNDWVIPDGYAYCKIILDESDNPIDFIFLNANHAYEKLTGVKKKHIIGKRFTEVLSNLIDDEFDYIGEYGKVSHTGEDLNYEFYSKALKRWFSVFAFSEDYGYFTAVFRDVTETKKMISELQRANYLNTILLDSIPHPALLVNKNRRVIAANKLAVKAGTIVDGFCWRDFGHCLYLSDEDRSYIEAFGINNDKVIACNFCCADNALSNKQSTNIEKMLGDIYWDIYWVPTPEEDVYLHYAIDITERKEIENSLRESELRFRQLAEASFEGICIHNDGIILDCNKMMESMFGYAISELIGTPLSDLFTSEFYEATSGILLGVKKDGTIFDIETLTGEIRYNGLAARVLVVRDITDKRQAEIIRAESEENARLLQETLEMDRLKTEFMANVSHELKTPLNIIFSTVQLFELYFKNGFVDDKRNKIDKGIKIVKQNCYRLLRLINNLIDVTKTEGRLISLQPEYNDIVKAIGEICVSVAEYMKDKNISFEFKTDIEEKIIACDLDKIETIILNLISNAIKFNRPGGSVSLYIHDAGDGILISVEDSGVGIPIDMQDKVFERFMQVDKSLTRNHEGSGIGLSIVKNYVDMHEGQIWLESEYGRGSKFTFKLPCKKLETKYADYNSNNNSKKDSDDLIKRIHIEFSDIYP